MNKKFNLDEEIKKLDNNAKDEEREIFDFVFNEMNPKNKKNNITSMVSEKGKDQFVSLDYFNSKILLLFQEVEYLGKLIIETKGFYKSILFFLREYKEDLIEVRYFNSKLKNILEMCDILMKNNNLANLIANTNIANNNQNYDNKIKNDNRKIKKNKKNKTQKINVAKNDNENCYNNSKIDEIEDEFKNIDLDKIDFEIPDKSNISNDKISFDDNSKNDSSFNSSINMDNFSDKNNSRITFKTNKKKKTEQSTNFMLLTDNKQEIFEIFKNLKEYCEIDVYKGIEFSKNNKDYLYYIYIHLPKKKRLEIEDLITAKIVKMKFKSFNIDNFVNKVNGRVIYNAFNN